MIGAHTEHRNSRNFVAISMAGSTSMRCAISARAIITGKMTFLQSPHTHRCACIGADFNREQRAHERPMITRIAPRTRSDKRVVYGAYRVDRSPPANGGGRTRRSRKYRRRTGFASAFANEPIRGLLGRTGNPLAQSPTNCDYPYGVQPKTLHNSAQSHIPSKTVQ